MVKSDYLNDQYIKTDFIIWVLRGNKLMLKFIISVDFKSNSVTFLLFNQV